MVCPSYDFHKLRLTQPLAQDIFYPDWLKKFTTASLYGINSVIALVEVLYLSSIRRQTVSVLIASSSPFLTSRQPIWAHIAGLSVLSFSYIVWTYIGKEVTGRYSYYFLDPNLVSGEYVLVSIATFIGTVNICRLPLASNRKLITNHLSFCLSLRSHWFP